MENFTFCAKSVKEAPKFLSLFNMLLNLSIMAAKLSQKSFIVKNFSKVFEYP